MHAFNRLSRNASPPSSPALKGKNHLIRYLSGWPHLTIMYPTGLYGTNAHELRQEVSPGDFHYQNISYVQVDFSDGGEGGAPNYKCAIY